MLFYRGALLETGSRALAMGGMPEQDFFTHRFRRSALNAGVRRSFLIVKSGEDLFYHAGRLHARETEVEALESIGESFVIDAE